MGRATLIFVCSIFACSCERETALVDLVGTAEKNIRGARAAAFHESGLWTDEIHLPGGSRVAITPPFPSALSFSVPLPVNPELDFSVALVTDRRVPRARVAFRVELADGDRTVELYRHEVRAGEDNSWHDARVDLGAWSGKRVKLTLSARPVFATSQIPWSDRILTAWGNPTIRTRRTAPLRAGERPSFIVILVDTLRADFLGAYGFAGPISPNLDRLAAESLLFEHCFANAPWTKPSVATLFTSLDPSVHGVIGMGTTGWSGQGERLEVLPENASTLAELLEKDGYRTAAFTANPLISPRHGFAQGFEVFERADTTDALLASARRWLAERASEPVSPFFLYLHVMDVHGPYNAPRRDFETVRDLMKRQVKRTLTQDEYESVPAYLRETDWASEEERYEVTSWRAKYGAGVHAFDRKIGPFLRELRTSGVLDRSYLVLTSDHGEELMEHGAWNHGNRLCDHQLHVPLLIRKPLAEDAGVRVPSLLSLADLMPTLLSLARVEAPAVSSGRDFSMLLRGDNRVMATAVFAEAVLEEPGLRGVRTLTHKLIWNSEGGKSELYDLAEHPDECEDEGSGDGVALARLQEYLRGHLQMIEERRPLSPETIPLKESLRERLKALGYVN